MPKIKKEAPIVAVDTQDNVSSVDASTLSADFVFRGPLEMRLAAEDAAAAAKITVSQYLKQVVASALGYTLPTTASRGAQLTDEEKKAKLDAQRAKDKAAREQTKALLDAHRKANAPAVEPTA